MADFDIKDGVGIIPEGTTDIPGKAFSRKLELKNITIPDSVIKIGLSAFYQCANLADIELPDTIQKIASYAFTGCSNLQAITLGKSLKSLGVDVFSGCPKMKEITCLVEDPNEISILSKTDIGGYHATLFVPEQSVELYKKKLPWKKFTEILPIGSEPTQNKKKTKFFLEWEVSNVFFQLGEIKDIKQVQNLYQENKEVGFHDDITSQKGSFFKWFTPDFMNVIVSPREFGEMRVFKLDKTGKYNEEKPAKIINLALGLSSADVKPNQQDLLQKIIHDKCSKLNEGQAIALGGYKGNWDRQQMSCVIDTDGKFEPANLFFVKSKVADANIFTISNSESWDEIGYGDCTYHAELGDDMGKKDIQEIIGYAQKLNGQFCIKVWPTTAADWDDILSKI